MWTTSQIFELTLPTMASCAFKRLAAMLITIILCLLVWLWVIEKRLQHLTEEVQSIKLDAEGMQSMKYGVNNEIASIRSEMGDLRDARNSRESDDDMGFQQATSSTS